MQKIIYKYQLRVTDHQLVELPEGAEILTIQIQSHQPVLWALVDIENAATNKFDDRSIVIIGTGNPIPVKYNKKLQYLDTFQMADGRLIWHVFELMNS